MALKQPAPLGWRVTMKSVRNTRGQMMQLGKVKLSLSELTATTWQRRGAYNNSLPPCLMRNQRLLLNVCSSIRDALGVYYRYQQWLPLPRAE